MGNQAAIYQTTYKVYKECDSTSTTRSEGTCSGSCGSQRKQITTTYKDSYTNKSCKTDTSSASCVTSNCKTPSCSIPLSGGTKGGNGWYRGGTVTYTLNTTNATAYGIDGYNSKKTGTIIAMVLINYWLCKKILQVKQLLVVQLSIMIKLLQPVHGIRQIPLG